MAIVLRNNVIFCRPAALQILASFGTTLTPSKTETYGPDTTFTFAAGSLKAGDFSKPALSECVRFLLRTDFSICGTTSCRGLTLTLASLSCAGTRLACLTCLCCCGLILVSCVSGLGDAEIYQGLTHSPPPIDRAACLLRCPRAQACPYPPGNANSCRPGSGGNRPGGSTGGRNCNHRRRSGEQERLPIAMLERTV